MGAIVNGLNLHGLKAFGSTFFNFLDYMKGAVRLAALMHLPSIFVFTHDSIGLGEDGPTHQPVEQLATLRAQPERLRGPAAPPRDGARGRHRAEGDAGGPGPEPAGASGLEPERGAGRRDPPRGIRAASLLQGGRATRPDSHRHRLGAPHLHRGGRPAGGGRNRHPRRIRAVPRPLRRAGRGLPQRGAAAGRARACVRGGGGHSRLEHMGDRGRRGDRHGDLRGLGPSRTCTSTSASPPRRWPNVPRPWSSGPAPARREESEWKPAQASTSGSRPSPRRAPASGSTRSAAG